MVDLLPAVGIDEAHSCDDEAEQNMRDIILPDNQIEGDSPSTVLLLDNRIIENEKEPGLNMENTHNGDCDNQSLSENVNRRKLKLDNLDIVEDKDFEMEVEESECYMTKSEARSVSKAIGQSLI